VIPETESVFLRSVGNFCYIGIIFLALSISNVYGQDPVINEFMSRNDTTLPDQDGDFPDWIELYNPGEEWINLTNYSISDNLSEVRKWIFPDVSIPPGGYLLIFASGKDRSDSGELHTNFKISSQGEPLVLSQQTGAILDLVDSVKLTDDQAMARIPDGSSQWFTSSLPTPGSSNKVENQLTFSHEQGFYQAPFHLNVSSMNGDTVRYTLDGSVPSENSAPVSEALLIDFIDSKSNYFSELPTSSVQKYQAYKAWESPAEVIDKIHVIRCASFRKGERSSQEYTHSYLVSADVYGDHSIPVVSIVAEEDELFGFEKGIFVPGIHEEPDRPGETGNFFMRGEAWERPIHIEFFETDGTLGFSQDAGIRVHGGLTRHAAQKSLRVYARDMYGKDSFDYPLFPQKPVESYKRFLLRGTMGGNDDNALIRDVLAHELSRELNFEIQDYQPVVVYINGEYWGIQTLRDRIDEHYLEYSFDIDSDSVDIITANPNQVVAGTNQDYMELAGFISTHDISIEANYDYVKSKVDVSSLTDYVIAEMFFSNSDWPGNNQKLWRPQKADGRWRWIFFDLDQAYDGALNMFGKAILKEGEQAWDKEPVSSFLMRHCLKNEDFRSFFISRIREMLKEDFSPSKVYQEMNAIVDLYSEEMPQHISRWHYPSSVKKWEDDIVYNLLTFLIHRPCDMVQEAARFFDISDFGYDCPSMEFFMEHFTIAPNPSDGKFYFLNNSSKGVLGSLLVRDNTGRIVHLEDEVFLGEFGKKYINLAHLAAGVYYLSYSTIKYEQYSDSSLSFVESIIIY